MWEPEDLERLLATLRDRVDERRRAGEYPTELEQQLAEHFEQLTVERPPAASSLLGQLDAARAELHRVEFARHDNDSSRLPGGQTAHRVVNKAVARQIDDIIDQAQRHAAAVDQAVSVLTDVVVALTESYDARVLQQIGDLQMLVAEERAQLHEIARRLDEIEARTGRAEGPPAR